MLGVLAQVSGADDSEPVYDLEGVHDGGVHFRVLPAVVVAVAAAAATAATGDDVRRLQPAEPVRQVPDGGECECGGRPRRRRPDLRGQPVCGGVLQEAGRSVSVFDVLGVVRRPEQREGAWLGAQDVRGSADGLRRDLLPHAGADQVLGVFRAVHSADVGARPERGRQGVQGRGVVPEDLLPGGSAVFQVRVHRRLDEEARRECGPAGDVRGRRGLSAPVLCGASAASTTTTAAASAATSTDAL